MIYIRLSNNFNLYFQGGMCLLGSVAGVGAYYLDQDSAHRNLWLIGSGVFFTIWPYTLVVMLSDIKKNLQNDAISTHGKLERSVTVYSIVQPAYKDYDRNI